MLVTTIFSYSTIFFNRLLTFLSKSTVFSGKEGIKFVLGRPPGPEMENCTDRESYSLAAGLALGLVMFGVCFFFSIYNI